MAITGFVRLNMGLEHTEDLDLTTPVETFPALTYTVSSGTSDNQMDQIWHDQRTLSASASEELDLADGTLVDAFGTALTFAEVRFIFIMASEENTNDVVVGGTVTHEWLGWLSAAGSTFNLAPGAMTGGYCPKDGDWAVSSGSSDTIQIANGGAGTSVTYDIYIGGTSA